MTKIRARGLVMVLAATLAAAPVHAAAPPHGTVSGSVVDPSGQAVAGALVSLRSAAGLARTTHTSREGTFALAGVPVGGYDVIVTADGFRADARSVTVDPGQAITLTVPLRLSAVTETLVVTPAMVDVPISAAPAGTMAFLARDLATRQIVTVADALRLVPGGAIAATGGAGSVTSLLSRGGESDFTLVLVDGVKMNSLGGGFDFGHLTTGGVSAVEVVRGPQSAVFGADAIGGVVHVRTALGGPSSATASYEAGSRGVGRLRAGTTGTAGALRWGVHAERVQDDGWNGSKGPGGDEVSNDAYEASVVALAAAWQAASATTIRVDARVGTNERGYPGPFGSNPIGAFAGVDTTSRGANDLAMGAVSVTHEWTPRTVVRARGSWMSTEGSFVSPWGESASYTHRWSGHLQIDHALTGSFSSSLGVDADLEDAGSTYITGADDAGIPVERQLAGLFAEARWRPSAGVSVTGGVRLERIARAALAGDPNAYPARPLLPRDVIVSPNPRLAVSYTLQPSATGGRHWTRLHASAGTGIRAPDAFEIAFTDNPGLAPERSRSVDAGIEQALFGGRVILDATAFLNRYDDLIVAVGPAFANASRYRTDNISNARARGVEASAAWRTMGGIEARLSYTFVDSEILSVDGAAVAPAPFVAGDALIRRPRHQASADVVVARPSWSAYVRASGRGRVLDVEPNYGAFGGLFTAPGFGVMDAGAAVRAGRRAEVFARVDNLLDRAYEGAFGFPSPRRAFVVGLRVAAR